MEPIADAAELAEHHATDAVSIHALIGSLPIVLPARTIDLPAGHLLALAPGLPHSVEAAVDSAFLPTLAAATTVHLARTRKLRAETS